MTRKIINVINKKYLDNAFKWNYDDLNKSRVSSLFMKHVIFFIIFLLTLVVGAWLVTDQNIDNSVLILGSILIGLSSIIIMRDIYIFGNIIYINKLINNDKKLKEYMEKKSKSNL